jgi:hypothetical protein
VGPRGAPLFLLVTFPIDFFSLWFSILKNDMVKSLDLFNIRKIPEIQNMQKQENLK